MVEMHQVLSLAFVMFIHVLLTSCSEGTSIILSPSGMVSICPGGQVMLTCERTSGSFMQWTVSVPHLATPLESIVTSQAILSPEFKIGYTELNITHTSQRPLTSQMPINNVTTEINGSTIYCLDEVGNENDAPMIVINMIHKGNALRSADSLHVSLVNHFLTNDNVTVTLQWPLEDGVVYRVDVLPHTDLTKSMSHNTITINLIIIIQYNVTIVSSFCSVTTTKVLNYVTCEDYQPTQVLHGTIVVATGSDSPLIEGQFITYTCPPGFVLTSPNMSVCMGNGEWEPDPGEVECKADCGVPRFNRNVNPTYSSTLDGSVLILTCNDTFNITDEQILIVICHSDGNWIPDPAKFTFSSFTTILPGLSSVNSLLIILTPSIIVATTLIILFVLTLCDIKRMCVTKKTSKEDHSEQPTYEEITQCHKEILMEENTAYGYIIHNLKPSAHL